MSYTVVGLFNNRNEAQTAKQELIQKGFTPENIDVSHKRAGAANTKTDTSVTTTQVEVTDSVGNFFSSLFGDDETKARNHTAAAGDADAILTVHTDSQDKARQAAEILDRNGAIDIDSASTQNSQRTTTETTQSTPRNVSQTTDTSRQNVTGTQGGTTIPIIEEQLQVGKREVERGAVRIRSHIVEKPVEAHVRLREEHVVVNRHAANRAVTDSDLTNFKEGDIQITEHAEVPVVTKHARVVEEVSIGKNVTEHEETVRDTVKRTDVEVEEINTDTTARRTDSKS